MNPQVNRNPTNPNRAHANKSEKHTHPIEGCVFGFASSGEWPKKQRAQTPTPHAEARREGRGGDVVRLNAVAGLRAKAAALPGHQPPRVRLAAGPFTFTLDPPETLAPAGELADAVEAIRRHQQPREAHR
jgi:hypothetical protein